VQRGAPTGQMETIDGMLAVSPLAGGSPREVLSDVRWADWNAGSELAVVHYVEGHSRLEYPIGNVLYQAGGWISNIRFSPLGDKIAFMDHPALWDNRGTVCVVDLAGHMRTLSREWESESGLAWRPDGNEIWFTAVEKGNNLNLMAVDLSAKVRTLLNLPVGLVLQDIASDGRVLAASKSQRLAMSFSALGSKEDADLSWHDWDSARDISPDGQFVLFEDASEAAGPGYSVMLRKVDGTLPVRLGEGSAGGMSPDGKWAASISTSKAAQITLFPTGAGQPRTINVSGLQHIQNGWARFLPDGKKLSVNANEVGHPPRCYFVDASSGNAKVVTPEGVLCGPVSPDDRSIIGKGPSGPVLYSAEGGTPRLIPQLDPKFNPVRWSNDGLALFGYYPGELPSKVYKIEIATGKQTVIGELRPGAPAGVVMVAPVMVSGDGTRFAYSYNQTLSVLYLVTGLH
jgi:eukaryotic-like serine/threonine-protein kinase